MDLGSPTPATTDTTSDTSMARGLLMLSLLLMLMLTMLPTATLLWLLPLLCPPSTEVPSTDLPLCMAVSTATTMARGLLMPSLLLSLLLKLMPMPSTTTGYAHYGHGYALAHHGHHGYAG